MAKRCYTALVAAVLLASTGCVNLEKSSGDFTPEVSTPNSNENVRAFRVDGKEIKVDDTYPAWTQYSFTAIPFDSRGVIPNQSKLESMASILVRVYRPGYRIHEINASQSRRELSWVPALGLLDQEKAIDDLLGLPASRERIREVCDGWWELAATLHESQLGGSRPLPTVTLGGYGLAPGSVSPQHQQVLLFAANEYSRLADSVAASAPDMRDAKQRLLAKATNLERHAEITSR